MKKHRVQAVLDDDLEDVLKNLGLLVPLQNSELFCCVCGDTVVQDTLQGIIPQGKTLGVLCSKPECFKKLTQGDTEV